MIRAYVLVSVLMAAGAMAADESKNQSADLVDARWREWTHTDTVFKPTWYDSREQWETRGAWLREQVRFAGGLLPELPRTPLNAKVFDRIERDGYTIEKVYFESMPGFYVTGNLYRPIDDRDKHPAIACPHGHWPLGRLNDDETGSVPKRCIMLAKLGAVVFSYDMVGYVDSKVQIDHRDPDVNSPASALWGLNSLSLQTWNSVRVLDFVQSLPDVYPNQIGVTGASGGGTQTFILCAVDHRVQAAAPVNMISSTMQGGCICENAPLLRIDTNNMEIGALFAPRPMLMVSATGDWTKRTPWVEFPMIRGLYELYEATDRISNVHVDAPHNYNQTSREAVYRFFAANLLNLDDADTITEPDLEVEKPEDLRVFEEGKLPEGALDAKALVEQYKAAVQEQIDAMAPTDAATLATLTATVRSGIKHMIGSDWPEVIDPPDAVLDDFMSANSSELGYMHVITLNRQLQRQGRRVKFEYCQSVDRSDEWSTAIWIGRGLNDSSISPLPVLPLPGDMHYLFVPDRAPMPALADTDYPPRYQKFFTTFNRTDPAESVFDILTVLSSQLNADQPSGVTLRASGNSALPTLIARAMVPAELAKAKQLRTVIDLGGFDGGSDEAYLERLNMPGVRRIGGIKAIAAVAANGPLWLAGAENIDTTWAKQAAKLNGVELKLAPIPESGKGFIAFREWLNQRP